MDSNLKKDQGGLNDSVSLSRRRLLRTAASAAPLIATLPSGAAMAQASAANCVIEDQEAARRGLPDAIVEPGSDNYIRVPGSEKRYLKSTGGGPPFRSVTVYEFRVPGSPSRLVSVDKDGNWIDTSELSEVPDSGLDREFLVLYQPVPFGVAPTNVSTMCDLNGGLNDWPADQESPSSPRYCIAPIAKVDTNQPGNMGLLQSCWCSLNPGDLICR